MYSVGVVKCVDVLIKNIISIELTVTWQKKRINMMDINVEVA